MQSMLLVACLAAACELDTTEPIPDEPMTLVGADRQGRIHLVDETTGATTFLDSAFVQHPYATFPSIAPMGHVTSMAWLPTVGQWWVATARTAICANCIYAFDPAADSARVVRYLIEEVDTLADFAVDPKNGRLYAFTTGGSGYLFRVDGEGDLHEVLRTGVGSTGRGTTFWTDGRIYAVGGYFEQRLSGIEIERLTEDDIGPITYVGFPPFGTQPVTIRSLSSRPGDGVVFALVRSGDTTYLATLDPATAVVVNLGATSSPLTALAYVPTRLLP
jgi:hypothetical protein